MGLTETGTALLVKAFRAGNQAIGGFEKKP